jgi:GNAT superfamily N-acetyltransferase
MKTLKHLEIKEKKVDFVLLDLSDSDEMKTYYELFIDCFGERANVKTNTFEWFNLQSPLYSNFTFAFIDTENSRMMASYGLQPGDATVNGQIMKFVLCTNVMSHPNYAGQGLFQLIGKESLEFAKNIGISFAFGVPNKLAMKGHLRVGWEVVNELKFYECNINPNLNASFSDKADINKLQLFNDSVYLNLFVDKYKLYFNRTAKWAIWRLSKPHSDYLDFSISNQDEFAYVVLKIYNDLKTDEKKLHIVDFGYEKLDSFIELVAHTQAFAKKEGFNLINLWQYDFNTIEVQALKKLGFTKTDTTNPIIIHKLGNEIELPDTDWHITLFDNDVY